MRSFIRLLLKIASFCGWAAHFFFSLHGRYLYNSMKSVFITAMYRNRFAEFGKDSFLVSAPEELSKPENIYIGESTGIGRKVLLRCFQDSDFPEHRPRIELGDHIKIGDYSNISCCNHIKIGNGVRTGRMVMINDNSHGHPDRPEEFETSPIRRPVVSKGPIIIDENVWIGEKATILSNVHIGKGSVIAAHAVVTGDIPPYSVAGGVPARIIKKIK